MHKICHYIDLNIANMQIECTKYAYICAEICITYAVNMHLICIKYAITWTST